MNFSVTKNYVLRKVVDEMILVPVSPEARKLNSLLVLNPAAAFIYDGVKNGLSAQEIERRAREEFEGLDSAIFLEDYASCTKQLEEFGALVARA